MNMCSVRQLPREPNTLGRVQLRYRIHAFNEDLLGFIEDLQCVAEPSGHGGPVVRGAYMIDLKPVTTFLQTKIGMVTALRVLMWFKDKRQENEQFQGPALSSDAAVEVVQGCQ